MAVIGLDVETYRNLFYVGLRRFDDGTKLGFELSHRSQPDWARLRRILLNNTIVTYNGMSYDMPMVFLALDGADNRKLKLASDQIIQGNIKWWQVEHELGVRIPKMDHVDCIEPQPNAMASLKKLHGRLHGKRMQELPYSVDTVLTDSQMDDIIAYNDNDLDATEMLWNALREPMALRETIGKRIGMDLRSKSDTQVGAAIIKKRIEDRTGVKIGTPDIRFGSTFKYKVPPYIKFQSPVLQEIVEKLLDHDFIINAKGKADLPEFLSEPVEIGGMRYQMGIGGLHSTESNRSAWSDDQFTLIDADVASFYPAIILTRKLYPPAVGPVFLEEYAGIKAERLEAKKRKDKAWDGGLKISLNGMFGLTSNMYSFAFSPQMTIAITVTGQLSLLMLIERAALAGIRAISGNTDGATFLVPNDKANPIVDGRLGNWPEGRPISFGSTLKEITDRWEQDTGFDLEFVQYRSIHNRSVNDYFAVKMDGKVKRKGVFADQLDPNDMRTTLMKSPKMQICADAVSDYLSKDASIERTILESRDIRQFVSVQEVRGGGIWRGQYLAKVVRYIWSTDGDSIHYKVSGNKVPTSDGARELMNLPDEFPDDIDYARYIREAHDILVDIGVRRPLPVVKYSVRSKRSQKAVLRLAALT